MTYYYITGTQAEIEAINTKEATDRGCQPPTIYWYSMAELKDGSWGMFIDDGKEFEGMKPIEYEAIPEYLA